MSFVSHSVTGGWDTNNVEVDYKNDTFITCNSTHLTSFAVLVDVSGGTNKVVRKSLIVIVIYLPGVVGQRRSNCSNNSVIHWM